jgi:hypothetical protein
VGKTASFKLKITTQYKFISLFFLIPKKMASRQEISLQKVCIQISIIPNEDVGIFRNKVIFFDEEKGQRICQGKGCSR